MNIDLPKVDYEYPSKSNFSGLVIVGEAPGAEEVKQGKPFVGRSGKLLNGILEKVGIDRSKCLIANSFRYQPPKNKVDTFFISQARAGAESREISLDYGKFSGKYCLYDWASEIDYLRQNLIEWEPKVIVALGRTAFWALTGQNALLTSVGKWSEGRLIKEIPIMPTYHPSFILRGNWRLQDDWAAHFKLTRSKI